MPSKQADAREAEISKSIEQYLNAKRIYNDRINSGKVQVTKRFRGRDGKLKEFTNWVALAKKGTPDRFFIIDGRIFFVEVKRKGKEPRPEQIERHKELEAAGAVVINADSLDSFIRQFTSVTNQLKRSK